MDASTCACSKDKSFAKWVLWVAFSSSLDLSSTLGFAHDWPSYQAIVLHCYFELAILSLGSVPCCSSTIYLEIYSIWIFKFPREASWIFKFFSVCHMKFSRVAFNCDIIDSNIISSQTYLNSSNMASNDEVPSGW